LLECGKNKSLPFAVFDYEALRKPSFLRLALIFFHISMIAGYRFCGNVGKSGFFLTFPSIVRKVWEKPDAFPGFFHGFPQYVISIKQASNYN
jgi:hypothetical protein